MPMFKKVLVLTLLTFPLHATIPDEITSQSQLSGWIYRFGNNFIQLINIVTVARHYSASVYVPPHISSLLKIFSDRYYNFGSNAIPNDYYLNIPYVQYNMQIPDSERYDTIRLTVLPKLEHLLRDDKFASRKDILTIHLRTGDIWEYKQVNVSYIQPPLAFYQEVISRHPDKSTIQLIFDYHGESNPYLTELITWIKAQKKRCLISQESTLEQDFLRLASSQTLVHSASSLCEVAALINYLWSHQSLHYTFRFIAKSPQAHDFSNIYEKWTFRIAATAFNPQRIKVVLIGGEFGEKVIDMQQKAYAQGSEHVSFEEVKKLYKKTVSTDIYWPPHEYP